MLNPQQHIMHLETIYPTGIEEWACPECGRRFVAQWEPKFRRVILEQGNETMIHKGQGMGFQTQISVNFDGGIPENDVELDNVWKQFLDKLDFGLEDNDLKE